MTAWQSKGLTKPKKQSKRQREVREYARVAEENQRRLKKEAMRRWKPKT